MTVRRFQPPVPTLARRRSTGDTGANALEWVGITIVVAGVLVGLSFGLNTPLADGISIAVCKVLNGGDSADCETSSDEEYKPTCTMSQSSDTVGGNVDVAFFSVNADYTLMKTVTYDPVTGEKTVKVTGIKGRGVGVGTGVGAGTNFGLANASADLSIDANLEGSYGESWSFSGDGADADADALIGDLQEQYSIDAVKENGGLLGWAGGGIYDAVAGPDIPDSNVHTFSAEVSVSGTGSLGASLGPNTSKPGGGKHTGKGGRHRNEGSDPNVDPGAKGYVSVDGSEKVTYEVNDDTGEESATFMLSMSATDGYQLGSDAEQSEAEGTGSVKITKGPDGNMKSVTLTSIQMVDGKATETITEIPTETDEERAIVQDKLLTLEDGGYAGMTAGLTVEDFAVTEDPGEDGDPFNKLVYDNAKTSKVDYDYDKSNENYGANAKLGLKLGVGLNIADSSQEASNATYLGAPGPDGTRAYKNYGECSGTERKKGTGVEKHEGRPTG